MLRHFRLAVQAVVLGASFLLNLAPAAEEPAAANRLSVPNGTTPRPAAERWERLKTQYKFTPYETTPAPVPRLQPATGGWRPEAGDRKKPDDAPAGTAVLRAIPSQRRSNSRVIPADPDATQTGATEETVVPVRTAPSRASAPEQLPTPTLSALPEVPTTLKDAEPEWVLPVPISPDDLDSEGLTTDRLRNVPEIDGIPAADSDLALPEPTLTIPALPKPAFPEPAFPESAFPEPAVSEPAFPDPVLPEADKRPYEEKTEGTSAADAKPVTPGTRRLAPNVPGSPPVKTTQVRRMSDIAPVDDFDKDSEIKQYAAKMAREFNVRFGGDEYTPRNFPEVTLPWTAPESKFYPLYFQDPALERYGHTHHPLLQPVVSSARFSAQLVMMPYQLTIVPPWELHSPLGWYRPGDVVPKLRYPFPWNAKAAAVEAAAITGFIYLIP